jgi:hypothetical protein
MSPGVKLVTPPLVGRVLQVPQVLNASDHTVYFVCGNCGAWLMQTEHAKFTTSRSIVSLADCTTPRTNRPLSRRCLTRRAMVSRGMLGALLDAEAVLAEWSGVLRTVTGGAEPAGQRLSHRSAGATH